MSFPEYLKERLSEDYRNLIIQKLEEVKKQSESLKSNLPSFSAIDQDLRGKLDQELTRVREALETELASVQDRMNGQVTSAVDQYVTSWYHSDISPFQQQLEILISDIVSNLPAPPKKANTDLTSLCALIEKMEMAGTQSEVLNILLKHISDWVSRAVLFVIKGENAVGWATFGIPDLDSSKVRQLTISLTQNHVLREAVQTGSAAYGPAEQYSDNSQVYFQLGGDFPKTALAFPIIVRGKIAGILYSDLDEELSERPDLANLLTIACKSAGMTIDLLPVRPKPAPKQPNPATVVAEPQQAAPPPPPEPKSEPAPEPEAAPITMVSEVESHGGPTVPITATPFRESTEDAGSTVIMPSPLMTAAVSTEDQKLHEDAKRFARLLVSEIKLYNEAQVSAGRENKDLYERLKDDIERSRRMYLERVPEHIHSTTNYFYEELVRTLANGDPVLLGM
jgi:hypothetical protein